jgi:cellulose synthase operon protein C
MVVPAHPYGPLGARPTGNAGIIYRDLQGYVQAEIYAESIDESILSYVGMKDPYTGQLWGRVIESGGALSVFRGIGGNNTIFAKASYGWIDGSNTEDNAHFSGVVALSHEFAVRGFEYVTVGPAVSYESFENNQNHFTYGHGGYFSPQSLLQGIIQAQFLTKEGSRWLAAGMAGVGIQTNEQDSAPFFPLRPDGRNYGSQSSTTGIGLIDVTGAYLINPNWLIGGSAGFNVTADYNEGFINIWVRYYFERRNGLVRDDLGLQGLTPVY